MADLLPGSSSKWRWFILALLAWTVLAAIPTSSAYIAEGSLGFSRWLTIFGNIAPYYYLWALFTPAIYRLATTSLHPASGWGVAVLGHMGIALVLSFGFGFLLHYNNWQEWLIGSIAPGYYTMSAFSYIFILLGIYLYSMQQKIRLQDAELANHRQKQVELEATLARSQLDLLRGQMNPHFLFNALNCIGALIETRRNERAYEALEDLGSLLRTSLEHRNQELVPLSDELAFAQRYIAMERVRFGDRLSMEIEIDSAAAQWPVPPFLLQPLIENTVKHAVAPSHETVKVTIHGQRTPHGIQLEVSDNGPGQSLGAKSNGTGVGLENLRKRLQLVYGKLGRLEFEQNENGTRVRLLIPDHGSMKASINEDQSSPLPSSAKTQLQH